jgi:zinc transport system permease protein
MNSFFEALTGNIPIIRYALFAGLTASISLGVIGTYVVTRRISYIAGAISHSVLAGIGISLYLKSQGISWLEPIYGAAITALLSALIIGLVSIFAKEREDTVIGAIWAIGMAVGLLFIAKTPGYVNAMSYLFGDILLISKTDLWVIFWLNIFIVVLCVLFYNKFLAICFDEEFTSLRGVKVSLYYMLLLCMVALTVVLLVRIVGIVMVIALLTIPPAIAGQFTSRLWQTMIAAVIFCMLFNFIGIGISYKFDLPSGPTIIVFTGGFYLLMLPVVKILKKLHFEKRNQT